MPKPNFRQLTLLISAITLVLAAIARPNQTPFTATSVSVPPDTLRAVAVEPDTQAITLKAIAPTQPH
ncbi:MAG: hypothetical protein AAFZ17_04620 [Cyanobacteria bacterium J06650_10]